MGWRIDLWWIIGIITIVAIIWMVIKIIKRKRNLKTASGKTPLDIYKERYSRGDIGKKEFEEHKKDLM